MENQNMKCDKEDIILRRIQLMEAEGVTFVCETEIGVDVPAAQLKEENDALLLTSGATIARDLPIKNRSLKGIHYAMEFLHSNTKALLDTKLSGGSRLEGRESVTPISVAGKRVIVIGGGDTGNDCLGTSARHGAVDIVNFELLPQPPPVQGRAVGGPAPVLWAQATPRKVGRAGEGAVGRTALNALLSYIFS